MTKREPQKCLNIRISARLHDMLKKLSVDAQLSCTDIITQYLEYLRKLKINAPGRIINNKLLHAGKRKDETTFELELGYGGSLHGSDELEQGDTNSTSL